MERIVFLYEHTPAQGVRVLAAGEVDEAILDALAAYVAFQRKMRERGDEPTAAIRQV